MSWVRERSGALRRERVAMVKKRAKRMRNVRRKGLRRESGCQGVARVKGDEQVGVEHSWAKRVER
jgi:hypothetical protein